MKRKKKYLKYIVVIACLLLVILCILSDKDFSVQAILEFTPQNPLGAVIVLLLLYALKSATVFFPLIILEIATGHLFPVRVALGVNFVGILIVLSIPYWIGRAAGMEAIQKLIQKYPRFEKIIDRQQDNSAFICFFLRIISCLPGDVVTMYFGATRTPFLQNLIAGTLGILPGMVLATLIGESIQNPESPMFWISALLTVTLSVLSLLLYYLYRCRLKKSADKDM